MTQEEKPGETSPRGSMQISILADIQSLKQSIAGLGKPLTMEMNNLRKENENINREMNRLMT